MKEIKKHITELYFDSLKREKRTIEKIKEGGMPSLVYLSLLGENYRKAWYYLFIEKDLQKTKQCFYLYGKVYEYMCNTRKVDIGPGMAEDATYTLLSDSKGLIRSFTTWRYNDYDKFIKKGETKHIIQLIAANEDEKAFDLINVFFAKHRKYGFKEIDGNILKAILEKDKSKVEELLCILLLPKNHKRRNNIYPLRRDILSFPTLGFAKLAWIRGVEVEIDHPLIPKELLPIKSNENYANTYEFLIE
jgi:hypothetical protein